MFLLFTPATPKLQPLGYPLRVFVYPPSVKTKSQGTPLGTDSAPPLNLKQAPPYVSRIPLQCQTSYLAVLFECICMSNRNGDRIVLRALKLFHVKIAKNLQSAGNIE